MSYEEVIFYFVAAVTVLGALGVVLSRNVVHSALFLILALLAVAGVYILLSAEFLAIVQILIYGGAVTILILFVMMLTRVRDRRAQRPRRVPALFSQTPRLVIITILALLLLACAAVAAYFLYPVPKGFDITVSYGHRGSDVFLVTAEDLESLVSSPWNDGGAT